MRQHRNWRMHQVNEHRQRIDERKLYNLCINNLLDIVKVYMCTRGHIFCDEGDRTTFRVAQVLYPERYHERSAQSTQWPSPTQRTGRKLDRDDCGDLSTGGSNSPTGLVDTISASWVFEGYHDSGRYGDRLGRTDNDDKGN
jgi:hypothetical protein